MPTYDEIKELLDNTTHKSETINKVIGMSFTSNINGHKVFIPYTQGSWNNNYLQHGMSDACLVSSQVHEAYINNTYRLYCYSNDGTYISYCNRACAFPVRGVFKK